MELRDILVGEDSQLKKYICKLHSMSRDMKRYGEK